MRYYILPKETKIIVTRGLVNCEGTYDSEPMTIKEILATAKPDPTQYILGTSGGAAYAYMTVAERVLKGFSAVKQGKIARVPLSNLEWVLYLELDEAQREKALKVMGENYGLREEQMAERIAEELGVAIYLYR